MWPRMVFKRAGASTFVLKGRIQGTELRSIPFELATLAPFWKTSALPENRATGHALECRAGSVSFLGRVLFRCFVRNLRPLFRRRGVGALPPRPSAQFEGSAGFLRRSVIPVGPALIASRTSWHQRSRCVG